MNLNSDYKIISGADPLISDITPLLGTKYIGHDIRHYDEIDSTNLQAKRLIGKAPQGCVVIAGRQLCGRGRLGRSWQSDSMDGIWMSVLLYPNMTPEKIACITLAAGYAVCNALRGFDIDAKIKWPNDIVFEGKKLCGILAEMTAEAGKITGVVVGIGVNVNQQSFSGELEDKACSLSMAAGHGIDKTTVIAAILNSLEQEFDIFCRDGFEALCEKYNALCANIGRDVVVSGNVDLIGKAERVLNNGALLVDTTLGKREITYGEVSVRGLLGYV